MSSCSPFIAGLMQCSGPGWDVCSWWSGGERLAGTQPCRPAVVPRCRWLSTHLDVGAPSEVNLFETTIRVLGGLLSAQALSADTHPALSRQLAEKAADLGARLMPAFNSPSGAPAVTSARSFSDPDNP